MRPDIVNLRQFYSSRLGRKVKARLRRITREHWAASVDEVTLGIGYANPVLRVLDTGAQSSPVISLMPASQGAIYWPVDSANHSILGDEMRPPFAPNSLARVVMLHALEHVTRPDELLSITWQLLAPGGRLLLIVPNRHGLWASMGATPFALGTPYTHAKLRELLNEAEFTLRESRAALFTPPSAHPFWLHAWPILEWLGHWCFPRIGGVLVIEAEKQIYAGIREPVVAKAQVWAPAQQGVPA